MKAEQFIKLLEQLKGELGYRAKNDYSELFGPGTIQKLEKLIVVLNGLSERLTEQTLFKVVNNELMSILEDADVYAEEETRDSARSLAVVHEVIVQLNRTANRGAFGDHEITFKTNRVASWLNRRLELEKEIEKNRLER